MLTMLQNALARLRRLGDQLSFLGPALVRLTVGVVFIGTGWGKLHSLPQVTEFFASLHIPAPAFQARLAASTEFFGGIDDYVVDRFDTPAGGRRIYLRPKVPFGA